MPEGLGRVQIERFARDGFLFPVRILSEAAAAEARARTLAALEAGHGELLDYKANLAFRWIDAIAHAPALLEAVAGLLGPDLLLWSCSFAIKPPRSAGRFTWHQDATYWGLDPPVGLTAWLALGPVDRANGAMQFVPGAHRGGQLRHVNTFAADVMLPRGQEIVDLPDGDRAVDLALASGEASFHHVFTPHASGPNGTDTHRIGCAMVFIPTHVRQARGRESAMLVRGEDRFGHFETEPRPAADLDAAALRARHAAMTMMATYKAERLLPAAEARR
jgi:ectoine hydroxylase-related dioxygenase (phytanoyl-CoA dioxygenase family)